MKKFALAFLCLVGLACFTSCNPDELEPTMSLINEAGYVSGDITANAGDTLIFGFDAKATGVNVLNHFELKINEQVAVDSTFSSLTFSYVAGYICPNVAGVYTFEATVTDVIGLTATQSFVVTVEANALEAVDFTWERVGAANGTGLEEFGLSWIANNKEVFASIRPVEGCTLYGFSNVDFAEITTEAAKAALFVEAEEIERIHEVSADATADYDLVYGTNYNGEFHLIHITHATVSVATEGTTIVINGQAK